MLEKTLKSPLDSKRSNQLILKGIKTEYALEGLMRKLKLQPFGHLMRIADSLEENPDAKKRLREGGEGGDRG